MLGVVLISPGAVFARDLTFEERVGAQEAIERVHYAHQVGATLPFSEVMPRTALEKKVRTYLAQSAAVETIWHIPITSEMLRLEMVRQAAGSRMPERLRELYSALHDDPFLVEECLARPALVDRLSRTSFSSDRSVHDDARLRAEALRERLQRMEIDPRDVHPLRSVVDVVEGDEGEGSKRGIGDRELPPKEFAAYRASLPGLGEVSRVIDVGDSYVVSLVSLAEPRRVRVITYKSAKRTWDDWWATIHAQLERIPVPVRGRDDALPRLDASVPSAQGGPHAPCLPDDTWNSGTQPDGRTSPAVAWTGSVMVVWGGWNGSPTTGGRYDPATDTWTPTSAVNAPRRLSGPAFAWTGSRLVVWGGADEAGQFTTEGGRYDPLTDTWTAMSTVGAPPPRVDATAVWTGGVVVVWGGFDLTYPTTGGRYDPVSDTWSPTSTVGAPPGRRWHTAVSAGGIMIVWGGQNSTVLATGGRYNPATDTWSPTSTIGAPTARSNATSVWTGTVAIVWGGYDGTSTSTGGRYNPATDTWSSTSIVGAPAGRTSHTAVWTGSRMVVWGGYAGGVAISGGGRYDPSSDTWSGISSAGEPSARMDHVSVWTGSLVLIWGGDDLKTLFDTGARYDPAADTWTPMFSTWKPGARFAHTAVWTGSSMIVWGGRLGQIGVFLDTGATYDPATDTWTATSTVGAPSPRDSHTASWTGTRMVVWGGFTTTTTENGPTNTGGRYDPAADTWSPTSLVDVPTARENHASVWAGKELLVWGGSSTGGVYFNTGGRYDPDADRWSAISTTGAPLGRQYPSGVWTGSELIVWGGYNNGNLNTGGRYRPATNDWLPTSTSAAPSARYNHTAVWSGSKMIVWGGGTSGLSSGGRYDPVTDAWTATSTTGVPSARYHHTAVWSGAEMVVWGGKSSSAIFYSGGRYDPVTNLWLPTSTSPGVPAPRESHTAVWTGSFMMVWGGLYSLDSRDSGASYALGHTRDDDGDGFTECQGDCNDASTSTFPGATDVCDSLDNDCNGAVDDAGLPPAAVAGLAVGAGGGLQWTPIAGAAYDVVKGNVGSLRATGGNFTSSLSACMSQGAAYPIASDPAIPATGAGFYYLVRATGCGLDGTYDDGVGCCQQGSRDAEIDASASACP